MLQEQFWTEFYRLKVHTNYVELLLGKTEHVDRAIKIALAITSSGSIGGWVIWKEYAAVWGTLIAASQVINAIRQYLPYKERLHSLSGVLGEVEELLVQVEDKWLQIAAGDLTEVEIRKALLDLRTKRMKSFKKHFPSSTIPDHPDLFSKAESKADEYFSSLYPTEQ